MTPEEVFRTFQAIRITNTFCRDDMPWQFPHQPANPLRRILNFYWREHIAQTKLAALVVDSVYEEQSQFLELADLLLLGEEEEKEDHE